MKSRFIDSVYSSRPHLFQSDHFAVEKEVYSTSAMAKPRGKGFLCTPLHLCMVLVVLTWMGGFLMLIRNIRGPGGSRNLDSSSSSSSIPSTAIEAILPYGQRGSSQTDKTRGSEAGAKITMPVIKTFQSRKGMESAARNLLARVLGDEVAVKFHVIIEEGDQGDGDWFEASDADDASSAGKNIILKGTNGVAIASALNWYLRYIAKIDTSWNSETPFTIPMPLPKVGGQAIKKHSLVEWSYYENVCTFSYTQAWWSWDRWQREIDWMAMSGINLPLALTGYEYVQQRTFERFGVTREEMQEYFTGPGFLAWNRMVNIKGWGGPLPQTWIDAQHHLQKKILERQRSLGMVPILPAFSGGVPDAIKAKHPTSAFNRHGNWGGFEKEYCCLLTVDPQEPLFAEIGKAFIEEVTKAYGTDHIYSCDTFNENRPGAGSGKSDLAYLAAAAKAVYESMRGADPDAVWVMQGWLFTNDARFWKEEQLDAYLGAVPKDRIVILDLFSEVMPVWNRKDLERPTPIETRPWIWNMLHSFGGNSGMYGRMQVIARDPVRAYAQSSGMIGIGITTEGIEQNPAVYELMAEMRWHMSEVDVQVWIHDWADRRMGPSSHYRHRVMARSAWGMLAESVYSCQTKQMGQVKSMVEVRPRLDLFSGFIPNSEFMPIRRHYQESKLVAAWHGLYEALEKQTGDMAESGLDDFAPTAAALYDMVDLTRQVLSDLFARLYVHLIGFAQGHASLKPRTMLPRLPPGNLKTKQDAGSRVQVLLGIIKDLDELMGTQKISLFGKWIADARGWGTTEDEKARNEFNARNLLTRWGPRGEINDYASRQWNGLMGDYYYSRWESFLTHLGEAIKSGTSFDELGETEIIAQIEAQWQHLQGGVSSNGDAYLVEPQGDVMSIVKKIRGKYLDLVEETDEESIYAEELPGDERATGSALQAESGHN